MYLLSTEGGGVEHPVSRVQFWGAADDRNPLSDDLHQLVIHASLLCKKLRICSVLGFDHGLGVLMS